MFIIAIFKLKILSILIIVLTILLYLFLKLIQIDSKTSELIQLN